jgi:hypothetical protein
VPEVVYPVEETTFGVIVSGIGDGVPVPGSGQLHYSVNGGVFVSVDMIETAPNEYEATLPAIICMDSIDFYLSAEEQTVGIVYDHLTAPYHAIPLTAIDTIFSDDFETDLGWTVSGGQWARGVPTGGGGTYGSPDPSSGYSGSNILGYNLDGDYGIDIPEYHVTSPAIDCSESSNTELRFWRWLGVELPNYDHAYIRISTDGSSWTTIWENTEEITDASWAEQVCDISSYADNQATVTIRFTMGTTDEYWIYCGWNIDDVSVISYACEDTMLAISTASLPDWTVEQPYLQTLSCVYQYGNTVWADRDGDLNGTGLSMSVDGVLSGIPVSTGDISFVAQVIDELPDTAEKTLTFMVNPAVEIITTDMPEATGGQPYSHQLSASGGTGTINWAEVGDGLNGTGLSLNTGGVVSGTADSTQTIEFTVSATDSVGSIDQQTLTIEVIPDYVCGDADASGAVDIDDVVYLIAYIFSGGPEPVSYESGDADCSGDVDIDDVVYLINYIFSGGNAPCDTDWDEVPDC